MVAEDIPTAAGTEREADPGYAPMEIGLARKISHALILEKALSFFSQGKRCCPEKSQLSRPVGNYMTMNS